MASLTSNVLATLGSACAQVLQGAIPMFQLNLSRYVFQTALCGTLVCIRRQGLDLEAALIMPLIVAGVFSNLFNISYYTASALLPLGTLLVTTNVTQVINSAIINKVVFKQNIQPLKVLYISLMIVGLCLILQPPFIFHGVSIGAFDAPPAANATARGVEPGPGGSSRVGEAAGSVLAIVAGVASTSRGAVYRARLPTVPMGVLGFWIGVLGTLPSVILMLYVDDVNLHLRGTQVALLLGHGMGAASYSTLNIYAQQKLTPVTWAMMDNSKLVLNFILQYTLLRNIQPGHRNFLEILGALVAIVAIVGAVVLDLKADNANKIYNDFKPMVESKQELKKVGKR